ncbi:hypothetical protein O7600_24560 [Micromonospora sp. WMMA1998]|uniref:hypothetical protein n=1 Tax=Micromonospora sp. WMMA1998 TaxID=3015167 RepID=UPI00248AA6F1|nr:hypothetical protein [Micromonospora sp. WMMA1998]WBC14247.1 hypothetical protein O7600_24560 [Micromonospora sp. WMMA1998]
MTEPVSPPAGLRRRLAASLLAAAALAVAGLPWAAAAVGLTCLGVPAAVALRDGPAAARALLRAPRPVRTAPTYRRSRA